MTVSTSPVLIVGAGISGLALAQGLLKSSIPFRIFERDPVLNVRSQGYRVRINGLGIAALESVLTPTLFSRLKASCAQVTLSGQPGQMGPRSNINAVTGEKVERRFGPPPPGVGEVEPLNADRSVLRSVLMHGLEEYVEFGKTFTSYELPSEGGVVVHFSDGSEASGRLLIGTYSTSQNHSEAPFHC